MIEKYELLIIITALRVITKEHPEKLSSEGYGQAIDLIEKLEKYI